MIELDQVSKKFGERLAVDGLSLAVPRGEIFGLLGHNGAGKSTAIGMMLGQVWPTAGKVRLLGFEVSEHRARALQKVGAIFESPAFYDYLSGYRNLEILSSYSSPTPRSKILEAVEWVGLSGREHSKVRTYSHGMRARLALAQALLPGPELLILDEPSDGLDPEGIHEMRQTILRLHRDLKITLLLSSHLLNEVEQVCTRIAVLNHGRKVFEGSLSETRCHESMIRLKTSDFNAAALFLRDLNLVSADRPIRWDGGAGTDRPHEHLLLREGVGVDSIVRALVDGGFPVYEIGPAEQTLESFYLSLMGRDSDPAVAGQAGGGGPGTDRPTRNPAGAGQAGD